MDRASVGPLLYGRRPSAVGRLVVAVNVQPVNGHAFRPLAHISEEIRERLPAITHRNATTAVLSPPLISRTATAIPHSLPRDIRRAAPPSTVGGMSESPRPEWAIRCCRFAVLQPTAVVHLAPRPSMNAVETAIDGAEGGSLIEHLESTFQVSRLGLLHAAPGLLSAFHFTPLWDAVDDWLCSKTGKEIRGRWRR
jgi:hypothetical protein